MTTTVTAEEGRAKINRWTSFCAAHLAETPVALVPLRDGLRKLAEKAAEEYPRLAQGEEIVLTPEVFEGTMDTYSFQTQQVYLDLTMAVLLTGVDGPAATAKVLEHALESMVGEIALRVAEESGWMMMEDPDDDVPDLD